MYSVFPCPPFDLFATISPLSFMGITFALTSRQKA
jgi:hypothetical protein